ncbi:Hypothetical predicted protein [Drosophila guanche]|uniref:Uncharacterized protein n=1 Tax=Drosophila guanche TaxID=7266 RepID=A0A3B0JTG3_DROGU|nr:Hypothetical predicted protein [Drosophila guanche]
MADVQNFVEDQEERLQDGDYDVDVHRQHEATVPMRGDECGRRSNSPVLQPAPKRGELGRQVRKAEEGRHGGANYGETPRGPRTVRDRWNFLTPEERARTRHFLEGIAAKKKWAMAKEKELTEREVRVLKREAKVRTQCLLRNIAVKKRQRKLDATPRLIDRTNEFVRSGNLALHRVRGNAAPRRVERNTELPRSGNPQTIDHPMNVRGGAARNLTIAVSGSSGLVAPNRVTGTGIN